MQRLHFLTGESRYALAAERTLAQFHSSVSGQPAGHATLLTALEEHQRPARTVILRGLCGAAELEERARAALSAVYHGDRGRDRAPRPAPVLAKPAGAEVNAWVCEGVTCLAPIDRLEDLARTGIQAAGNAVAFAQNFLLPENSMKP